ncbi:glutamine amidotransferase-related protein [Rhodanobacter denitrificans]|uniref:glutamine amidotransferase-related protein n=1 Tax=Rhodanobacter denitrificans TaxID=666685 RepID=UPI001F476942|nr:gamma-glutamyl-gamma-aminobutyrate hydrolase family protein [Rhodanobacter denitrificans]UJJ60235.1 gamma-glutamyl-gamma-aminobutyrate hydrolase family protein [Rhodanobacter denitrificans]
MRVQFIVHEAFEAPGALEVWVRDRGHEARHARLYANEPLPREINEIDLLVVLGGPQSPATGKEECPHFDGPAECRLIRQCINAGKAVLGICLGAQLIGCALGATHERSPEAEVGAFPIQLTAEGRIHPKFAHVDSTLLVGHWHNDMPGLPEGAKVLARSEGCPRQILEYGNLVYGFQCHMEFTQEVVDGLVAHDGSGLAPAAGRRFVQTPDAMRSMSFEAMNQALFGFLDRLAGAYAAAR